MAPHIPRPPHSAAKHTPSPAYHQALYDRRLPLTQRIERNSTRFLDQTSKRKQSPRDEESGFAHTLSPAQLPRTVSEPAISGVVPDGGVEEPAVRDASEPPDQSGSEAPSVRARASSSSSRSSFAPSAWPTRPFRKALLEVLGLARTSVFYSVSDRTGANGGDVCVLNMAALQAVALSNLQRQIASEGHRLLDWQSGSDEPFASLDYPLFHRPSDALHDYCQALRDLDYMQAKATQGVEHDPFLLQSSKLLELSILRDAGFEMAETGLAPPVDALHPVFPGVGRTARIRAARLHNKYTNFAFGLGGGLALIVPMIIMTMIPNIISSLVTTSAFVIAFSSIIAWRSDLKPQEVLAVTAGYAAVLVVFVGTNQSRGNGS